MCVCVFVDMSCEIKERRHNERACLQHACVYIYTHVYVIKSFACVYTGYIDLHIHIYIYRYYVYTCDHIDECAETCLL